MELVELKKGKVFTSSKIFSDNFKIPHNELLKRIRKLTGEYLPVKNEFVETDFVNERNRKYPMFLMTRQGFMFLVMNTGAKEQNMKKVWDMQTKIIMAFDEMERQLLQVKMNENSLEWKRVREDSITNRKKETGAIKEFVEYAISQGSKSAEKYYIHITNATYRNLSFMQLKTPKLRESLDTLQLSQLIMVENMIEIKLKEYMSEKTFYKEIYKKVAKDIENLCNMLGVNKLNYKIKNEVL